MQPSHARPLTSAKCQPSINHITSAPPPSHDLTADINRGATHPPIHTLAHTQSHTHTHTHTQRERERGSCRSFHAYVSGSWWHPRSSVWLVWSTR
mmetsp:Transcript_39458/g.112512  ORF Transcript_39458/g.112512 Transcript_39458/m.112512 type:complete len:95 (+) Transcript_39458:119-403(+)